jgi:hypothetical protein
MKGLAILMDVHVSHIKIKPLLSPPELCKYHNHMCAAFCFCTDSAGLIVIKIILNNNDNLSNNLRITGRPLGFLLTIDRLL